MSLRKRAPALVLGVLGLAVALALVVELVARLALAPPPDLYVRHPLLGISWAPGARLERFSIDRPPEPFILDVNPLGFRGRAMQTAKKPAGTYRIFFLGASTTENSFLPEERTFPGRVQKLLDERLSGKPRIEVANAGVAAMTIGFTQSILIHRVLPLEPDLVVVFEGHNDLSDALRLDWDPAAVPRPEPPPRFKDWLVGVSRLVAVLDYQARKTHSDKHRWYDKRRAGKRGVPYTKPTFDVLRGIPDYKTSLARIALICKDARVPCAFLTQPSLYKDVMKPEEEEACHMGHFADGQHFDVPTLKRALDAYNEATREVARSSGSLLVDLVPEVPGDLEHFVDDVHLTSKGNEKIAEAIVRVLLGPGKLP